MGVDSSPMKIKEKEKERKRKEGKKDIGFLVNDFWLRLAIRLVLVPRQP